MDSKLVGLILAIGLTIILAVTPTTSSTTTTSTTIRPETYEIRPKILESRYFPDEKQNVQGAVVLKSNLPANIQNQLAATLTSIYQSTTDPMQRLQQFQTVTTKLYPVYWNIVSNFENITYFSQYYIYLQINSDRVLAFGLS